MGWCWVSCFVRYHFACLMDMKIKLYYCTACKKRRKGKNPRNGNCQQNNEPTNSFACFGKLREWSLFWNILTCWFEFFNPECEFWKGENWIQKFDYHGAFSGVAAFNERFKIFAEIVVCHTGCWVCSWLCKIKMKILYFIYITLNKFYAFLCFFLYLRIFWHKIFKSKNNFAEHGHSININDINFGRFLLSIEICHSK